jgi:hypothetical protein
MPYKHFRTAANADPHADGRSAAGHEKGMRHKTMTRLIGFLLLLALIAVIGLIGYSYSGYLVPDQTTITLPVDLDAD